MTSPEDADRAAAQGIDVLACVMNPSSPRYVTTEQVWEIRRAVRGRALLLGVFADLPEPLVQRLMDHCQFDCAQLFGSESRAMVDAVRPRALKAVSVSSEADAEAALRRFGNRRASPGDLPSVLLSLLEGVPASVVAAAVRRVPAIVAASGTDPSAVGRALAMTRPWGVDTWDSVESAPGRLDIARLQAFIAAVRETDATDITQV